MFVQYLLENRWTISKSICAYRFFLPQPLPLLSESTKQPELRFRALLTDGAREVRFERAVCVDPSRPHGEGRLRVDSKAGAKVLHRSDV